MNEEKFNEKYKSLNEDQKRAVDTIDGPVMVIAGPGTGKTTMLTLRIANILRITDTPPDAILALTFTESAVRAIRKKLIDIVGQAGYRVRIHTFHSFANDIISSYPSEFPRIIGSEHATDTDTVRIIENAIINSSLNVLKPWGDPLYYLKDIKSAIRDLKREAISPDTFEKSIIDAKKSLESTEDLYYESGAHKGKMRGKYKDLSKSIQKNEDLSIIYRLYEEAMAKERLFDYEDMIMEVIKVLSENESLSLQIQESAQYILADEHQDANNSQNTLLEIVSSFFESPNLFIVGDEKQAIFRFQGASLDNFLYFKNKHPDAVLIQLSQNYRSTQALLNGSFSMIKNNITEDYLRVSLKGRVDKGGISVISLPRPSIEAFWIGHSIKSLIESGVSPNEIAVIYRDNKDSSNFMRSLSANNISYTVFSDTNLLEEETVEKFVAILRAANEPSDFNLSRALFIDILGIDLIDVCDAITESKNKRISLSKVLSNSSSTKLRDCFALIERIAEFGRNKPLLYTIEYAAKEIGLVSHMIGSVNGRVSLRAYDSFLSFAMRFAERKKSVKLPDFFEEIDRMENHGLGIPFFRDENPGTVSLMTAHRSKGLEFEYVFIASVSEGKWSGRKMRDKLDPFLEGKSFDNRLEDERRLLYVAITRAKKQATISYFEEDINGKETLPSELLSEIDANFLEQKTVDTGFEEKTYPKLLESHGSSSESPSITEKSYLNEMFLRQGFSVSALNSYLNCPWQYFFVNLLRVPKIKEKPMIFGTAIHEGLKTYFNCLNKGKEDIKAACSEMERSIERSILPENEVSDSIEKGKEVLTSFIKKYKGTWTKDALVEFPVSGIDFEIGSNDTVTLKGKLDRVEFDKSGKATVFDFKTGKPKSRASIEGKTKDSNGDMKRQLTFYKLLLERLQSPQYDMKEGVLDFVEPNESGKYKREAFEITNDDILELEETIKKSAYEILELSFWDKTCTNEGCEWCKLSQQIKKPDK
ncbi:MAG: hypothetical protein COV70_04120 [Parcubacteria group bacterium CG11_big_fil_rev_8_21_14_0_20_39_22]|nr:MAG: hypothetical protein COV70_04120 [Parcubacteria group bacterium CG11_big_fil_rev_8_21_14_0_20_39_22]